MAKKNDIGLTFRNGQWSKGIGSVIGADGKRTYHTLYFGSDKKEAERLARIAVAEWAIVKASNGKNAVWPPATLARLKLMRYGTDIGNDGGGAVALAESFSAMPTPNYPTPNYPNDHAMGTTPTMPTTTTATTPTMPISGGKVVMLYDLIKEYSDSLGARARSNQVSAEHANVQRSIMARLKTFLPNQPMYQIGYKQLRALVDTVAQRPVSEMTKQKVSAKTVSDWLGGWRAFFSYAETAGAWNPPTSLDKCFACRRDKLMTVAEREAKQTVKIFTIEELCIIWKHADDIERLYILLGLNCGFTQLDIATLLKSHLFLDAKNKDGKPTPYIKRLRNKTLVPGKFRLWEEAVVLLLRYLNKDKNNPHALLSRNGFPLVHFGPNRKTDAIAQTWSKLLKRINGKVEMVPSFKRPKRKLVPLETPIVRPLSFKYLRKTGSDFIRRIGGKDVSEAYLCHTDKTMGKVYNNIDFKPLGKALRKMRKRLQPMFDSGAKIDTTVLAKGKTKAAAAA